MLSNNNKEQKSPKRRFLLILGGAAFVCFCIMGLALIFWKDIPIGSDPTQRKIFGGVILVYAVLRFSRYLRKDPDEVDEA
ncbi:hypothetical protein [Mucilaginibacter glaciei]|uniref:Uncharacterized protein n=1 Tax=Mucilaginibacter glaciei TaxID=2772109 RepID=A0A926NXS3_9SPHI|nr:hypothetical protein [Mucilaginibacter glaciei]MBD1393793.1 hypothetical protein [Mucilaginibacter glaciei]